MTSLSLLAGRTVALQKEGRFSKEGSIYVSVHEILSLIACATTQISLRIFKVSPELSSIDTYIHVDK